MHVLDLAGAVCALCCDLRFLPGILRSISARMGQEHISQDLKTNKASQMLQLLSNDTNAGRGNGAESCASDTEPEDAGGDDDDDDWDDWDDEPNYMDALIDSFG